MDSACDKHSSQELTSSIYQKRFCEFVERHPEGFERRLFFSNARSNELYDALENLEGEATAFQPWPVFLDSIQMSGFERLGQHLFDLVRSLPQRWFSGDARRLCEFYGLDLEVAEHLRQILALPRARDADMMRGDFLMAERGLQLLEVNAYANLGGLHISPFARAYLEIPFLQRFFVEQEVVVRFRDPWRVLLAQVIDGALSRDLARGGRLDLAVIIREPKGQEPPFLEPAYHSLLAQRAPGIDGNIVVCRREDLQRDGAVLTARGRPVQVVLCYYITCPVLPVPIEVQAWLDGVIDLYPGPMSYIHSDKRNLALLSEGVDRGLFTGEDAAVIDRHVPWTRLVQPGPVHYRGECRDLETLLLDKREVFVLKPAQGFGGGGIIMGRFTAPEEWREQVRSAFEYGTLCVQEYVTCLSQRLQQGEVGSADFLINWGLFVFADRFGGTYLRLSPAFGNEGFIGVTSGAEQSFCYELSSSAEVPVPHPLIDQWSFHKG